MSKSPGHKSIVSKIEEFIKNHIAVLIFSLAATVIGLYSSLITLNLLPPPIQITVPYSQCEERAGKIKATDIDSVRQYVEDCKDDPGSNATSIRTRLAQIENDKYDEAINCIGTRPCIASDCILKYRHYFNNYARFTALIDLANKKLPTYECTRSTSFRTDASIAYICGYDTDPKWMTMQIPPPVHKESPAPWPPETDMLQLWDGSQGCPRVKNSYYSGNPSECDDELSAVDCTAAADAVLGFSDEEKSGGIRDFVKTGNELLFNDSQYFLDDHMITILDKQVDWLLKWSHYDIVVEGNADDNVTREENAKLGAKRAELVAQYLIEHGISRTRVTTKNLGASHPMATCGSEFCHSANRRVVTVLRRGPDR